MAGAKGLEPVTCGFGIRRRGPGSAWEAARRADPNQCVQGVDIGGKCVASGDLRYRERELKATFHDPLDREVLVQVLPP